MHNPSITLRDLEIAYHAAMNLLPNANIVNLISKANEEPHRTFLIELFKTDTKVEFTFDDPSVTHLYMNGILEQDTVDETESYIKFASPFVQSRLFNYFAREIFREVGPLYPPFTKMAGILTPQGLNVRGLLRLYEQYLQKNHEWLFRGAPRKSNLRLFEAVYHFNLFMYLNQFLLRKNGQVHPEFPTGNGQIDLLLRYQGQTYGVELKSYTDDADYAAALGQAARYAQKLNLNEIIVVFFVEAVDEATRAEYQVVSTINGVTVYAELIVTFEA